MRVYLTGFMGAGKTTVGSCLAAALGWPFVDLDQDIERRTGLAIRELFAGRGEAEFRVLEREALRGTLEHETVVVATGGGTVSLESNRQLIRANGLSVWLCPPFVTIIGRIGPLGKSDRPLFRSEAQALALYRERYPAYRQCDLRIDVAPEERPEEVAARIGLLVAARFKPARRE